jgi:hypothetical protein
MYYRVGGKPIHHGTEAGHTAHYQALNADRNPCEACQDAAYRAHKGRLKRKAALGTDSLTVPALGTQRRIRALQRMGWPTKDIGEAAGMGWAHPNKSVKRLLLADRVRTETAVGIDRAYEQLQYRVGPSRQLQLLAIRRGWAPPGAWDDVDDPEDTPKGMTKKEIVA